MSPTPKGVTITAAQPDGATEDITEGVQVLYDLVIQSMDWGSGFLTVEDVQPVVALARACGFEGFEEADKYLAEQMAEEERARQRRASGMGLPGPFFPASCGH